MLDLVIDIIGSVLYPMFSIIFLLLFLVQDIFYGMAGIGDIRYGGYGPQGWGGEIISNEEGGLVYYLLQSSIVKNLIISIGVLALILLVVFTIMAFIKNIYSAKPKDWKEIIGDAIKGLAMFIVTPVCCLLGVFVGNIVLRAVNSATNTSSSDSLDGMLFITAAYNANRIRMNENFDSSDLLYYHYMFPDETRFYAENGVFDSSDPTKLDREYYADVLDDVASHDILFMFSSSNVRTCYSLGQFNYLLLIAGGIFLLYIMLAISFGMIKRLFMILVLFVISPVVCALYPIKGGSPVKTWTDDMVKQTISAYGAVAGMNIMFALLPLVQNITFPVASYVDVLGIIPLLMTIAGLYIVKDVMNLISNYIGADNAYATGSGLMGSVKGGVKKYTEKGVKATAGVVSAFSKANMAGIAARDDAANSANPNKAANKAFFGSLGKSMLGGMHDFGKNSIGLDIKGATKDAWDKGKKDFKEDKGNKRAASYFQAVDDYKDADKELKGLLDPNNAYLTKLSSDYGMNSDSLIGMAKKGQTFSDADLDKATPSQRAAMESANVYLGKAKDAFGKKDYADYIIKGYTGATGTDQQAAAEEYAAQEEANKPKRRKKTNAAEEGDLRYISPGNVDHGPKTHRSVVQTDSGNVYSVDVRELDDYVQYTINPPNTAVVPQNTQVTSQSTAVGPTAPYSFGENQAVNIANANITQTNGQTNANNVSGTFGNADGILTNSDLSAKSNSLPVDYLAQAFEDAVKKLGMTVEDAIDKVAKDFLTSNKGTNATLEQIKEALESIAGDKPSGGAGNNTGGKKGKK